MSRPAIIEWDQAYNRNGDPKLPRAVVNVIRTYMDNDTVSGWVSQETLMENTGLSESQVRRQIKANVETGWLEVVKRGCVGKATDYRLTYPEPVTDDRLLDAAGETNTGHIRPVSDAHQPDHNRSRMTGLSPKPGMNDRFKPVMDDTPTSPRTSPQEKFFNRDPFEGTEQAVPEGRGRGGPSLEEAASESAAEHTDPFGSGAEPATGTEAPDGLVGLRPASASQSLSAMGGCRYNPFCEKPQPCDCGTRNQFAS